MTSSDKYLHVISFDVPYPPDYGGVIDIYYKLRALHDAGVKIHLHCFEYGRQPCKELEEVCASVRYYERKTTKSLLFNTLPYIVLSRRSEDLKKNLLGDDYPVWMEGLHTTFLLADNAFDGRKMVVRTHNVEHDYYANLANTESNIFKRYYFYNEAGKLKKYEQVLHKASAVAAISPNDTKYFSAHYRNVNYIPAFHPHAGVSAKEGRGEYAFYHGNLAIGENNEAALFLVNKVFDNLPFRLLIAGRKPSGELQKAVKGNPNVLLMDALTPGQIQEYISNAHCNILPTFQPSGIKLKLLSALFAGRFCIVNSEMVSGTGLEPLCITADSAAQMQAALRGVFESSFTQEDIKKRSEGLMKDFSNSRNAAKIAEMI